VRDAWKTAMRNLAGPALFGDGLPSTVLSVPANGAVWSN